MIIIILYSLSLYYRDLIFLSTLGKNNLLRICAEEDSKVRGAISSVIVPNE